MSPVRIAFHTLLVISFFVQVWIIRMVRFKLLLFALRRRDCNIEQTNAPICSVTVQRPISLLGTSTSTAHSPARETLAATRYIQRLLLAQRTYRLFCDASDILMDLLFEGYIVIQDAADRILSRLEPDPNLLDARVLRALCHAMYLSSRNKQT